MPIFKTPKAAKPESKRLGVMDCPEFAEYSAKLTELTQRLRAENAERDQIVAKLRQLAGSGQIPANWNISATFIEGMRLAGVDPTELEAAAAAKARLDELQKSIPAVKAAIEILERQDWQMRDSACTWAAKTWAADHSAICAKLESSLNKFKAAFAEMNELYLDMQHAGISSPKLPYPIAERFHEAIREMQIERS